MRLLNTLFRRSILGVCANEIYKLKKEKRVLKVEKYILAVVNPETKEKHFGKPNTLDEVIKESKLFKNITIYTEKEYQQIVKGIL